MPKLRKQKVEQSKLLKAMQFLSVCQKSDADNDAQMHCSLLNHTAVAFDGILAAGIMIDENLDACPHTQRLILALSRCGPTFQIIQLTPETLQVRSDGFEAFIPCCKRERLTAVNPDTGNIPVTGALTSAIETVAPLASDKADVLEAASIKIDVNSVLATNREMILEAWHSCKLPFGDLLIPKIAAIALGKIKKQVIAIGIRPNIAALFPDSKDKNLHEAMTFWFEDNSWLRTNLHKGKWRDKAGGLLKLPSDKARTIPASFFETVAKVLPFSEDGQIYCAEGRVSSHGYDKQGAGYSLPVTDGPVNKIYSGKNLLLAGKLSTIIDEHQVKDATLFFGANTRSVVSHIEFE